VYTDGSPLRPNPRVPETFQIILEQNETTKDGRIIFQYRNVGALPSMPLIGIETGPQNPTGYSGLAYPNPIANNLAVAFLPAAAVGTIPMAIIARMTRSSMLDVLGLDYVRTARAKGLRVRQVIMRHALRNAMLPVVTVIGLSMGGLLSGAVLTETVFNLAGVGRTLYESISARDYTVVQAFTLVIAVFYVAVNLLVDVLYAFLDPRIRLS